MAMLWDDARYFLALYRAGTLSAAARALAVEHTTVARRIGHFESALGLKLFDRLPRSWTPTSQAVAIYEQVCALEEAAFALERQAATFDRMTGRVRISAPPVLASHVLVPRLADLAERYPNIALEIQASTAIADLNRNEAEIAVRLARPDASDLLVRRLGTIGYRLYATSQWRARAREQRAYIGFDGKGRQPLGAWLEEVIGPNRVCLRTGDFRTMAEAARAGWGAALLPVFFGASIAELSPLEGEGLRTDRDAFMLFHRDVVLNPAVRAIASEIAAVFRTAELA